MHFSSHLPHALLLRQEASYKLLNAGEIWLFFCPVHKNKPEMVLCGQCEWLSGALSTGNEFS